MNAITKQICIPLFQQDLEHVLNRTEDVWEDVRGRNVFITGGTGFFGMWLVESFCYINQRLDLRAKATLLSREPSRFEAKAPHVMRNAAITLHKGDVRTFQFPTEKFDFLIHAGTTASWNVSPKEMLSTIVIGTERVIEFAAFSGVGKLLFVSSGAVYGVQPSHMTHLEEDFKGCPDLTMPSSAYGEGKRAGELLCGIANAETNLECKIARCFAFVGPHLPLNEHFAMGNFIRDALSNRPIRVNGDGTALRSYMYAADLSVWLWRILLSGVRGRPYNVGSDRQNTIADTAKLVAEASDGESTIAIAALPQGPGVPPSRYVPSINRAVVELGLSPSIEVREGIRRTIAWHRLNNLQITVTLRHLNLRKIECDWVLV